MSKMKGQTYPIKIYKCDDCQAIFKKRYNPQEEPITSCPECGDVNIHRIFKSPTGRTLDGTEPEMIRVG